MSVQLYDLIVDRRAEMEEIYGKEEIDRALSCGIVHYNGAKPWKEACPNMDIWWDCYRRSIFFDEHNLDDISKPSLPIANLSSIFINKQIEACCILFINKPVKNRLNIF